MLFSTLRLTAFLLLTSIIALLIAFASLPKQPLPLSQAAVEFGFAACDLPCWAGVTLFQTPIEVVIPLIEQHVTADIDVLRLSWQRPSQIMFDATSSSGEELEVYTGGGYRNETAEEIADTMRFDLRLPLWHLILSMGEPTCVKVEQFTENTLSLTLLWQSETLIASTSLLFFDNDWTMYTETLNLNLSLPIPPEWRGLVDSEGCETTDSPWLGFARLRHYAAYLRAGQ